MLTIAIVSLVVMLWFALDLLAPARAAQVISSLAADPPPPATSQASRSSGGGLDPTVVAAIIAAVAALVAALVAGVFALLQTRYNARLQKELDDQYKRKEQEEQRKADAQEMARCAMLLAQNNEERAKAYRHAVGKCPGM
jgi:uncharacterized protein HemX